MSLFSVNMKKFPFKTDQNYSSKNDEKSLGKSDVGPPEIPGKNWVIRHGKGATFSLGKVRSGERAKLDRKFPVISDGCDIAIDVLIFVNMREKFPYESRFSKTTLT